MEIVHRAVVCVFWEKVQQEMGTKGSSRHFKFQIGCTRKAAIRRVYLKSGTKPCEFWGHCDWQSNQGGEGSRVAWSHTASNGKEARSAQVQTASIWSVTALQY